MTVLEASCVLRECYMSRESGYEITPRVIFFSPPVIMENNIFAWWMHCLPGNLYVCVQEELFGWWDITWADFQQSYVIPDLALNL